MKLVRLAGGFMIFFIYMMVKENTEGWLVTVYYVMALISMFVMTLSIQDYIDKKTK